MFSVFTEFACKGTQIIGKSAGRLIIFANISCICGIFFVLLQKYWEQILFATRNQ